MGSMTHETAPGIEACDECGAEVEYTLSETIAGIGPRWDIEFSCPLCGNTWHSGGFGASPGEVRNAIIASNGAARIRITASGTSVAVVMKVLRSIGSLSLSEANERAHLLRGVGLTGTWTEVSWIGKLLSAEGISVAIDRTETLGQ